MKKKLNTEAIMNELEGSVFFPVRPENKPEEEVASKPANQQVSEPVSLQTSKEVNQHSSNLADLQTNTEASKQASLPVSQQTSKILKKFGSYLTGESLKSLKRIAFETDRKDYEVLQEAVDQYLERNKK